MYAGEEDIYCNLINDAFNFKRNKNNLEKACTKVRLDRKYVAVLDEMPVGVASSFGTRVAVPGGGTVSTAALDGGAVRPDYTRRGVRKVLMETQITDWIRRGEVVALLNASEASIFEHFGFGTATESKNVLIDRARASVRPDVPNVGTVRILQPGEALDVLPAVYGKIGLYRSGMVERPAHLWDRVWHMREPEPFVVVHSGPGGDDGFAVYQPTELGTFSRPGPRAALEVEDLHAADITALVSLWSFLLRRDLVAEIRAAKRPLDEPPGALLVDSRACETVNVQDQLWLRLIDVLVALNSRSFAPAPPVVVEVVDGLIENNSGRYKITSNGVTFTKEPSTIRLDVSALAMLYLGHWRLSTLVALGRAKALNYESVEHGDALFSVNELPWCGTFF
jgi:predicted acetyltransferase